MATNTLTTRIVLKNDTAENWEASELVPLAGEVCIENDTRKIKIGNGTDKFADLKYANLTPEEINTLISALNEAKHTHSNKAILDATTASFTTALLNKLNGITDASTTTKGLVQLTNSTSSTSTTTAATPSSVKSAYDLANTANTTANAAKTAADSKVSSVSLASGTNNGTLKLTVNGTATDNIAVKGLGSAAYTASSAYATSAQGTKADNAMPKSGGTFTGAVTLNADPTANLGAATKQYVDSQITSKIAASDAMVFKGTLGTNGTVTAVPTSGVVKGDTYKIITAGTYAGSACKVGDLIIAMTSGSPEATADNWAYVPSGNENETTISYSTTTQNLTTSAKTGSIVLGEAATKQVDTSVASGSTSTKLPTSAAVATLVSGQISTVTKTITDHTGNSDIHMTSTEKTKLSGIASGAEVNQNAFSKVTVGSTTVSAGAKTDTLTLAAGSNVSITPDATNKKVTIAATNTTYTAGTGISFSGTTINHSNSVTAGTAQGDANKTLTYGGTFTVPTVTYDAQGHITGKGTTTMTMPAAPTSVSGNAGSATKLQTARNIQTNLASTSAASFNGTANITPGVTGTLPVANGGTGATTAAGVITNIGAMDLSSAQTASGVKTFSNGIKVGSVTLNYNSTEGALVFSFS